MFVDEFNAFGGGEEPPHRKVRSSKGYPETRDPAAANPRGVLHDHLGEASLRKLRQHYAAAPKV
jgi:hypothetical protein